MKVTTTKILELPIELWRPIVNLDSKWYPMIEKGTNSVKGCLASGVKRLKIYG